jgi:hypothetical protein
MVREEPMPRFRVNRGGSRPGLSLADTSVLPERPEPNYVSLGWTAIVTEDGERPEPEVASSENPVIMLRPRSITGYLLNRTRM